MIIGIWPGWTAPEQADEYERLLLEEIFPGVAAREVAGFRRNQLLKRDGGEEVEFFTLIRFDSIEAVREFAGTVYEQA